MSRVTAIADQIRALAATGLHYTEGPFDRERYEKLLKLAAELVGLEADTDAGDILELYRRADDGYVTPKLDVRMGLFRDDRVLLVRERIDDRWALPGGFVDVGDSPSEAAVRETQEEAGMTSRVLRLAAFYDLRLDPESPTQVFHIHKILFAGELLDPVASPHGGLETSDADFCALDTLPELSLRRTLPRHIHEAYRVVRDPNALPHFD